MSKNLRSFLPLPLAVIVGFGLVVTLAGLPGCGSGEPFSYVKVSGKVSYDDGSLIPADRLRVVFISQVPPLDPKAPSPNGIADADPKTGSFDLVTSHNHGDGLVPGEHKVLIQAISKDKLGKETLRSDLVPPEYGNPEKTPLVVNTNKLPFDLRVQKPVPVKAKGK